MNMQYDVIVVGAGMVGMTAALGLAQQGLRIALIESQSLKEPTFPLRGDPYDHRVVAIVRSSEELFQELGVWEAIRNTRISPYEDMVVWDSERDGNIHFSSSMILAENLGHIIEQRVILAALWEKLKVHPGVTCFFDQMIIGIRTDVLFCEVDLKENKKLFAKLLIGADGAKSTVRRCLAIETDFQDYDQMAIVATLRGALPHRATAYQRFAKDGPLAWLPLADPYLTSIVWSTTTKHAQQLLQLSVSMFNDLVLRESDNRFGALKLVSDRFAFPLSTHHAKHYVLPRCALVGDAAHTVHPLAGLGVNLGLLDIKVLLELLAQVKETKRDLGSIRWLKRYERERRWHNGMVRQAMSLFKKGFSSTVPSIQLLRNKGLNYVNQRPKIKSFFILQAYFL